MADLPSLKVLDDYPDTTGYTPLANYEIREQDDLRLSMEGADDYLEVTLNGRVVAATGIGDSQFNLSFARLLKLGENQLRIKVSNGSFGGENYWSVHYTLGIFDRDDRPKYDAIKISLRYRDNSGGLKYDVIHSFTRV